MRFTGARDFDKENVYPVGSVVRGVCGNLYVRTNLGHWQPRGRGE